MSSRRHWPLTCPHLTLRHLTSITMVSIHPSQDKDNGIDIGDDKGTSTTTTSTTPSEFSLHVTAASPTRPHHPRSRGHGGPSIARHTMDVPGFPTGQAHASLHFCSSCGHFFQPPHPNRTQKQNQDAKRVADDGSVGASGLTTCPACANPSDASRTSPPGTDEDGVGSIEQSLILCPAWYVTCASNPNDRRIICFTPHRLGSVRRPDD